MIQNQKYYYCARKRILNLQYLYNELGVFLIIVYVFSDI